MRNIGMPALIATVVIGLGCCAHAKADNLDFTLTETAQ